MNRDILSSLRPALVMAVLFALLLGLAYPLAITGLGQFLFPAQAGGSLIAERGRIVGSSVVGQAFVTERYFHTRPSAAGKGYDGLASSGSNLGPASRVLAGRVGGDIHALQTAAPGRPVPSDLVTTSASGLDPDISPEGPFTRWTASPASATSIARRSRPWSNSPWSGRSWAFWANRA